MAVESTTSSQTGPTTNSESVPPVEETGSATPTEGGETGGTTGFDIPAYDSEYGNYGTTDEPASPTQSNSDTTAPSSEPEDTPWDQFLRQQQLDKASTSGLNYLTKGWNNCTNQTRQAQQDSYLKSRQKENEKESKEDKGKITAEAAFDEFLKEKIPVKKGGMAGDSSESGLGPKKPPTTPSTNAQKKAEAKRAKEAQDVKKLEAQLVEETPEGSVQSKSGKPSTQAAKTPEANKKKPLVAQSTEGEEPKTTKNDSDVDLKAQKEVADLADPEGETQEGNKVKKETLPAEVTPEMVEAAKVAVAKFVSKEEREARIKAATERDALIKGVKEDLACAEQEVFANKGQAAMAQGAFYLVNVKARYRSTQKEGFESLMGGTENALSGLVFLNQKGITSHKAQDILSAQPGSEDFIANLSNLRGILGGDNKFEPTYLFHFRNWNARENRELAARGQRTQEAYSA